MPKVDIEAGIESQASTADNVPRPTPGEEIRRFFHSRKKHVVSFAGFGELGYEDPTVLVRVVQEVLDPWRSQDVLVNSGTLLRVGGEDGIAEIYALAKARDVETSGIHPSVALRFADTHRVSPYADHVFFVDDPTWGGFVDRQAKPSPTLQVILDVSDELVVVGGGKHAADELTAFLRQGKRVRYFPAEMNHRATREWCRRANVTITDFRGAAHQVWHVMGRICEP